MNHMFTGLIDGDMFTRLIPDTNRQTVTKRDNFFGTFFLRSVSVEHLAHPLIFNCDFILPSSASSFPSLKGILRTYYNHLYWDPSEM